MSDTIEKSSNAIGQLYALNKQLIKQLPFYDTNDLNKAKAIINEWRNEDLNNTFYMMYGKEISYFTVFRLNTMNKEFKNLGEAVIEILKENNRKIYSVEKAENGKAIEIWIEENSEPTVLYLFPYDDGIVEVFS